MCGNIPSKLFAALAVFAILTGCSRSAVETGEKPLVNEAQRSQEMNEPASRLSGPVGLETNKEGEGSDIGKFNPVTVRGTGVFLAPTEKRAVAHEGAGGDVSLNFVAADVPEVVRSVLGGILHLNYVIDPAVKGTMTLQTSEPLARRAVFPALESALRLNGVAIVKVAKLYHVVPREKAPTLGAPVSVSDSTPVPGPGFTIRIVPLHYVSAAEMQNVLAPMSPKGSILLVDKARNLLMLAAPQQELAELEQTIRLFDVDWLKGMSFAVIPLEYVDPETLVKEAEAILADVKSGPLADVLRFVPVKRMNSVLVISSRPRYMERAKDLVEKLDQGGGGNNRQIFVYYVQNGSANDLAETLGGIFGISESSSSTTSRRSVAPMLQADRVNIARSSTTSTMAGAFQQETASPSTTLGQQRPAGATGMPTTARTRQQAPTVFQSAPKQGGGLQQEGEASQIRIVAAPSQNAILVWATPPEYRMIRNVLKKLDVLPLQVFIQATIAEVTLNNELTYGVQWFFRQHKNEFTLSTAKTGAVAASFPGFSYVFNGTDVRAVLQALESVTNVKVISAPTLMVLDNQTATLQVGDQVPVLTQEIQQTTNTDAPIVNSIELRDTGVILQITPRVNVGGLILMDIDQQDSRVATTTTSGIDSPTIQQRRITTTVAIHSGDSVALGGLIEDTDDHTDSGIPVLRDIPILGNLFGSKSHTKKRTELLMLLTPRSVASRDEAQAVTEELRKRLKTVIPLGGKVK